MGNRRRPPITAAATLLLALLASCGSTTTLAGGSESSGAPAQDPTTDTSGSTGSEPWDPMNGCNPDFDTALAAGTIAWTQEFTANAEDTQRAMSVAVDASSLVYAAGFFRFPNNVNHGWLHALSASGDPRWEIRYDGDNLQEVFTDLAVAPSGDVIVVGYELVADAVSRWDYPEIVAVVLAYSPAGDLVWRVQIPEIGWPSPAVAAGADGRIVVALTSRPEGVDDEPALFLADIDATDHMVERRDPPLDPAAYLEPADVQFDDAGNLYLVASGRMPGSANPGEWLGRWDAADAFLGASTYEHADAGAVAVNPRGGGALVLGNGGPYTSRPSLRRYDSDGVEMWAQTVEMAGESRLVPFALSTDCDGHALVAADYDGAVWLFRFDDEGNELGRIALETGERWTFDAMAADPFGNPVFAGIAYDGEVNPFVVRKYAR